MIGHVLVVDRAFSENTEFRNTTDDMVVIPSGKFKMGCNQFGPMHGAPEHWVYLNEFMIGNNFFKPFIGNFKTIDHKLAQINQMLRSAMHRTKLITTHSKLAR